jgi:His-Xaa-Ser repeat protein HxsA|tara:strand:- start:582 stop:1232 length:651 start_codon:yes stop_codon:yes gene_type:complete
MKKFLISSLLAAGFFNIADASSDKNLKIERLENVDLINNSKGLKSIAERNVPFTLMAHSSHGSHGSHVSHASHSSSSHYSSSHSSHASHSSHYSHYSHGSVDGQMQNYSYEYKDQGLGRNLNSTPNESILPRSPAIVDTKKNIKGRSEEFKILTQRAQLALYAMGYYSGEIDGLMNNETVSSISKYQNKHKLKVTGSLSDELIAYLDIGGDIEKKF